MDKACTYGHWSTDRYHSPVTHPGSDQDVNAYSHHRSGRYPDCPGCQSDGYGSGSGLGYCGCFYPNAYAPATDNHGHLHAHTDAEAIHPNAHADTNTEATHPDTHTDAEATYSHVHACSYPHPNAYGLCPGRGVHHGLKRCPGGHRPGLVQ